MMGGMGQPTGQTDEEIFKEWYIPEKEQEKYILTPTFKTIKGMPVKTKIPQLKKPEALGEKQLRLQRETLQQTMTKMKNLLGKVPSAPRGFGARITGAIERGKALAGYNKELLTYNNMKLATLGQITKVIGGETGSRLSDQDVNRMARAYPHEFMSGEERELQWNVFEDMVNDVAVAYGAKPVFERSQTFTINGKTYNIPPDEIEEFKKEMGIE